MPQVLDLDPQRYTPHALHGNDREWQETNCAADLWIEALHALGADPVLGLGFTLEGDFDGEQWRMFTFPGEDLRALFGIEMDELNVWRPVVDHLVDQLSLGHLVIVDVDAWHLPDTAGLTYRWAHQKTSVMVQMIDVESRRMGYFHNAGYYELGGEDFDNLFGSAGATGDPASPVLPPFALTVRIDRLRTGDGDVAGRAVVLGREHFGRRPASNPVSRLRQRIEKDLGWLQEHDLDTFHRYAFGTLRQCGANAELAVAYLEWLALTLGWGDRAAADAMASVATAMKSAELALARVVRGRACNLDAVFAGPERHWEQAMTCLAQRW